MKFNRMKGTSKSVVKQKISSDTEKIRSSQRDMGGMPKEIHIHSKTEENILPNKNKENDHCDDRDDSPFLTNKHSHKSNQLLKKNLYERLKPKNSGEENKQDSKGDRSISLETHNSILWNDVGTEIESSVAQDKNRVSFWKKKCQANQMLILMASSVHLTYTLSFFQVRLFKVKTINFKFLMTNSYVVFFSFYA